MCDHLKDCDSVSTKKCIDSNRCKCCDEKYVKCGGCDYNGCGNNSCSFCMSTCEWCSSLLCGECIESPLLWEVTDNGYYDYTCHDCGKKLRDVCTDYCRCGFYWHKNTCQPHKCS